MTAEDGGDGIGLTSNMIYFVIAASEFDPCEFLCLMNCSQQLMLFSQVKALGSGGFA